jgi:nicotinamidase-related amidase
MTTALIVIDAQEEYLTGGLPIAYPPPEDALARICAAMDAASDHGLPVVLVRHTEPDPSGGLFVAGTPSWELTAAVEQRPHDVVIDKALPGSFTGTGLQEWLAEREVGSVVLAGWMTHMCVDTTARQALHLGLEVTVLEDATGTVDVSDDLPAALVHRVELGVLGDGFAAVTRTDAWIDGLG